MRFMFDVFITLAQKYILVEKYLYRDILHLEIGYTLYMLLAYLFN